MVACNAYVTTDERHRLTASSRVYVLTWAGIVESPVPERAEAGGVLFWPRVAAALAAIGWRTERAGPLDESEPGKIRFNVEELPK